MTKQNVVIKFANVGREKWSGEKSFQVENPNIDTIAELAAGEAAKHLASSEIGATYDWEKNEGVIIVGGFRNVGTFARVLAVPEAAEGPIGSTVKSVRITLELDSKFLTYLKAEIGLGNYLNKPKAMASQALAIAVFGEGAGEFAETTTSKIPADWRDMFRIVADERRVYQGGKQISGKQVEA